MEYIKQKAEEYKNICCDIEQRTSNLNSLLPKELSECIDIVPKFNEFLNVALSDVNQGEVRYILPSDISEEGGLFNETWQAAVRDNQGVAAYARNSRNFPMLYVTTAEDGLGYGHYIRRNSKVHSNKIENLYNFATKDHARLISNRRRKKCLNDFMNLRDNHLKESNFNNVSIISLSEPVKTSVMTKYFITIEDEPLETSDKFPIKNQEFDVNINRITILEKPVSGYFGEVKISPTSKTDGVHCIFLVPEISHTIEGAYNIERFDYIGVTPKKTYRAMSPPQIKPTLTPFTIEDRNINYEYSTSTILDYEPIITNDKVYSHLLGMIDVWYKYSKRLNELKEEYSDLYFLNSDF